MAVYLLFPPGWTLLTGSAHVAIPALKSWVAAHGFDVIARDLNLEAAERANVTIAQAGLRTRGLLSPDMDGIFFEAEDKLCRHVSKFSAHWKPQLGFEYDNSPQISSERAIEAIHQQSPFDAIFAEVARDIAAQDVPIVGLCLASDHQIVPALQLCRHLRECGYEGFIVFGGNIVSRLADEFARSEIFSLIDGLITFQGEVPLLRLCEAIHNGISLETVPQLIWRDEAGIHWNKLKERFDPDSARSPAYGDLPVGRYWGENYLNLVASRGCYYGKCNFCAIPYGWGEGGYGGQRAANHVLNDIIVLLRRHGARRFKFVDEALSPSFMRALSEKILDCGLQIEWEGYARLEAAWNDPEFVRLIAKAGFRKGYFGLEILPSAGRRGLNKRDTADPEMLLRMCNDNGVKVHFFCMFGYPGTGEDDAIRTVDFLRENSQRIDTADIFPWTLTKHTSVPGIRPILERGRDWALEFDHVGDAPSVMSSHEIRELVDDFEEILWQDAPRLLHPVYRLVSPWSEASMCTTAPSAHGALIPS